MKHDQVLEILPTPQQMDVVLERLRLSVAHVSLDTFPPNKQHIDSCFGTTFRLVLLFNHPAACCSSAVVPVMIHVATKFLHVIVKFLLILLRVVGRKVDLDEFGDFAEGRSRRRVELNMIIMRWWATLVNHVV